MGVFLVTLLIMGTMMGRVNMRDKKEPEKSVIENKVQHLNKIYSVLSLLNLGSFPGRFSGNVDRAIKFMEIECTTKEAELQKLKAECKE